MGSDSTTVTVNPSIILSLSSSSSSISGATYDNLLHPQKRSKTEPNQSSPINNTSISLNHLHQRHITDGNPPSPTSTPTSSRKSTSNASGNSSTGTNRNSLGDVVNDRSTMYNDEAGIKFLAFVHNAFPTAGIEVASKSLLSRDKPSLNRKFPGSTLSKSTGKTNSRYGLTRDCFAIGRQQFINATLKPSKPHPPSSSIIDIFTLDSKYLGNNFEEIEVDGLLKIQYNATTAPPNEWQHVFSDTTQPFFFIAPTSTAQSIPLSSSITSSSCNTTTTNIPLFNSNHSRTIGVTESSTWSSTNHNFSPPNNVKNTTNNTIGKTNPITNTKTKVNPASSPNASSTRSLTFTERFYPNPQYASHYVVVEVYSPMHNGEKGLFDKIIQMERILQILKAKEEKKEIRDCVLGVIFMATNISPSVGRSMYKTIQFYQSYLPSLWSLLGNDTTSSSSPSSSSSSSSPLESKLNRVLRYTLTLPSIPIELNGLKKDMQDVKNNVANLETNVDEIKKDIKQLFQLLKRIDEKLPSSTV